MPIAAGKPICTGAPCTEGKRDVIWIARIASLGFKGRIETTSGPANGPAGSQCDIGPVHRHIRAAGHVAQLDAVLDQRLLERKRAAEGKADEIVAPDMSRPPAALRSVRRGARRGSAADRCGCRDPRPKLGRRGSPGSETASTGQGFGFAWANRRKSWASALGRMTRFAWTLPGASPAVGPEKPGAEFATARAYRPRRLDQPCVHREFPFPGPQFYSRSEVARQASRNALRTGPWAGGSRTGGGGGSTGGTGNRARRLDDRRRQIRVGRRPRRCSRRRMWRRTLGRAGGESASQKSVHRPLYSQSP